LLYWFFISYSLSGNRIAGGEELQEIESKGWRYTPHLIIFISSACIMIIELVAGRLIARHLGNSLYTWTSIIAVILAGMSIGNFIGGRMADRWKPESFIGWLFMIASALCLMTLVLNNFIAEHSLLGGLNWPLRTFLSVLLIFLMPALALGTISPVTAKMALNRSETVGATIGSVYAWGAVGSILGTLVTGFFLIAWLGSKGVVLSVALALAIIGLCLGPHRWVHAIWVVITCIAFVLSRMPNKNIIELLSAIGLRDPVKDIFAADSNYQYVSVFQQEADDEGHTVLVLRLDYLEHGYVDPQDPTYLQYEYEQVYADLTERLSGDRERLATFFIGGGSYSFPRWILSQWPGSKVDVAEIDPLVLEANYRALGLPSDTPIKTILLDARNAVDSMPEVQQYDLIFGDAFNDLSAPWHLLTLEFSQKIKHHLRPGGAYLVNVVDDFESGLLLGSFYLTLKRIFKNVYIFCTDADGVSAGRDTFVLLATDAPVEVSDLQPGHDTDFPGSVLTEANLDELAKKCKGRILTDDDAPVENLLEPVVRRRQ
jgi:predicted membrane-bound spermidine synthase